MKIGYACINTKLKCRSSRTFRLANFTSDRFNKTVAENLSCLLEILKWNLKHEIFFFRITSDLIPFASHPVNQEDWEQDFAPQFKNIGAFIKTHNMRVSMHPDQFNVLNSLREDVAENTVRELYYQCQVLDLMELDESHKVQVHAGGVYGDKEEAKHRFVLRYQGLDSVIKNRLVLENDEKSYSFADCYELHTKTGIPVVFDVFHHSIKNQGEELAYCLELQSRTWQGQGLPIIDYSYQLANKRTGAHAHKIDLTKFEHFISDSLAFDFDLMLEIKEKEKAVQKALPILKRDPRFTVAAE